jgi:riboflavin synthase
MFTGIVETMGTLVEKTDIGGDCRLVIDTGKLSLEGCSTGDSISVSGACLTMLEPESNRFRADVSVETLDLTILGRVAEGQNVNLELAMGVHDRMGGHLVTGHVDGLARLVSRHEDARAERFEFEVPGPLAKYIARKGSVCLDGVSLTVNEVAGRRFSVCLIPHTMVITTLGQLQPGDEVNLEVDLIARYLERLMDPELADAAGEYG